MFKQGIKAVHREIGHIITFPSRELLRVEKLTSLACPTDANVIYTLQHWTTPNPGCGPLTCFDSLEAFMKWASYPIRYQDPEKYRLFTCEYEPSGQSYVWFYSEFHQKTYTRTKLPAGTCFATRIKLIEEISLEAND